MARRLSTAQWLGRLHRAGRSDAEIGAATGRSASYIQKVRTGTKPGESLLPAARQLARRQQERTTGTARPLTPVAAPRRAQKLRQPQMKVAGGGRHRFYVSTPRTDKKTGKPLTIRPGTQLLNRIREAGKRGEHVRLTITWAQVKYETGHASARIYEHEPLVLWNEEGRGVPAAVALQDIESVGNYARDPEATLANLLYEQEGRVEWAKGIEGWQLHTFAP